jgi:hypothetical protein
MKLSTVEKSYMGQLLRRYKHSQRFKKLAMCSYYADRNFLGFISFVEFLRQCTISCNTVDEMYHYWNITTGKKSFFGFNTSVILFGDMLDLEIHIYNFIRGMKDKRDSYAIRIERNIGYEYKPRFKTHDAKR